MKTTTAFFNTTVLLLWLSFSAFGQTENPKQFVKDWVSAHQDVKLISLEMYEQYNEGERLEVDALRKKIIFQTYLTPEDILLYEERMKENPAKLNSQPH